MSVSAPFARILADRRAWFNDRVAEVRRRVPGFDCDAFGAFVATTIDPIVERVAVVAPERAATVAQMAFEMAITLCAQRLIGPQARASLLGRVWSDLFPELARVIADAPEEVLGALSNAAVHLAGNPQLRGQEWLQHMQALAPRAASAADLFNLGKLLAWRCGAAHFRTGALLAADELPEALAVAAVGGEPGLVWADLRACFAADPWWPPGGAGNSHGMHEIGDFSGFGGIFPQPPEVRASAEGFWVRSADRHCLLIADAWGAVLHPASAGEFASPPPVYRVAAPSLQGDRLLFAHRAVDLDWPPEGLSIVCNGTTAAVTSPYSHRIRLYPLP